MQKTQIKKIGDSFGILLNDEIDITVENRILIISPVNEKERDQKIANAVQNIFKRRKSAYQRLAEGV